MNKEYIRLKSDALQVEVNSSTGGINFYDATGRVLLKDKDYGTQFTPFDDAGTFSYNVRHAFLLLQGSSCHTNFPPVSYKPGQWMENKMPLQHLYLVQ